MSYQPFEELDVWKRSCDVSVRMYEVLRECRDFGLKDQMTRAAVSIASNIAEGAERDSVAEYIRFLHIAKGSAAELRTQVIIAARIGLISDATRHQAVEELMTISRQLHGLINYLKQNSPIPVNTGSKNLKPKT